MILIQTTFFCERLGIDLAGNISSADDRAESQLEHLEGFEIPTRRVDASD